MNKTLKGRINEEYAQRYLKQMGHLIIAHNLFVGHKEIDIISYYQGSTYVYEVRSTRRREDNPQIVFNYYKLSKIVSAIQHNKYLRYAKVFACKIDIVNSNKRIKFYPISLFLNY